MSFGPTNAPKFYTAMMKNFKDELHILFIIKTNQLKNIGGETVTITNENDILVGTRKIVSGICTIIDDIILFYRNKELIILCFECVCIVLQKY